MAVAKKNLSQIDKLVAVAAVACKLDHTSQKMPNRGWSIIANDINVSERRIIDIWPEYQYDISNHVDHHEISKPLQKARHDYPSQLNQDTMIAIDTAIIEKEG